jgi:hypothetical protein
VAGDVAPEGAGPGVGGESWFIREAGV